MSALATSLDSSPSLMEGAAVDKINPVYTWVKYYIKFICGLLGTHCLSYKHQPGTVDIIRVIWAEFRALVR
jgi:hypothetical protein